jgi:hypothetical protein
VAPDVAGSASHKDDWFLCRGQGLHLESSPPIIREV